MAWICTKCGQLGEAKKVTRGHFAAELVFWILGLVTLGLFLLVAIPYSLWRIFSRYDACSKCGQPGLIPESSPVGQRFMRETFGQEFLDKRNGTIRR